MWHILHVRLYELRTCLYECLQTSALRVVYALLLRYWREREIDLPHSVTRALTGEARVLVVVGTFWYWFVSFCNKKRCFPGAPVRYLSVLFFASICNQIRYFHPLASPGAPVRYLFVLILHDFVTKIGTFHLLASPGTPVWYISVCFDFASFVKNIFVIPWRLLALLCGTCLYWFCIIL